MRFRILLCILTSWLTGALAAAQSSTQDLPSAPSATVQESQEKDEAKQPPPTPPKAPPKPHTDNELRPGDNTQAAGTPPQQDAKQEATPAGGSAPSPTATAPPRGSASATTPATAPSSSSESSTPSAPALQTPPGAQNQDDEPRDPAATVRAFVNEVRVIFTVTDKHGRYIKDLKRNDFRVIDDGKPAVQIRSFRSETDLPLQVGLLIDASNSVRDRFKFEQESAIEFLNSIIRPKYDLAFTVGFDSTPDVTQDFTDNTELLSKGVRALRAGGGTAMYDALYYACRDKLMKESPASNAAVRRAIILLSDGDDNSSHVTREEAIEMAQRAEVIVYTISTNVTGSKGKGDKILERIAEATGGRAFFPFQIRDVTDAFGSIQDELRSQYAMTYKPADLISDGHFRTIEILAQQKAFKVRTRKGYFAPKAR